MSTPAIIIALICLLPIFFWILKGFAPLVRFVRLRRFERDAQRALILADYLRRQGYNI